MKEESRRNTNCKDLGIGMCLMSLKNTQKVSMVGEGQEGEEEKINEQGNGELDQIESCASLK